MLKQKKNVALLSGGAGAEHDISVLSARRIKELIDGEKFNTLPLLIGKDGALYILQAGAYLPVQVKKQGRRPRLSFGDREMLVDCALPVLHGDMGEDGRVQGALECLSVPYVGEGVTSGALCADKFLTKAVAAHLGIPCPAFALIPSDISDEDAARMVEERVGYPMILKPACLGSSVGIEVVKDPSLLLSAIGRVRAHCRGRAIAEEYLENKRELEVAYLGIDGKQTVTPPAEVLVGGFYSYDKKYGGQGAAVDMHPELEPQVEDAIYRSVLDLVKGIGICKIARFDFFLCNGSLLFNEINTMPGFTEGSLYPRMLSRAGIDPKYAITRLIEEAISDAGHL